MFDPNMERPLSPKDPVTIATCTNCDCEIYENEEYYIMDDGDTICQDCLGEWALKYAQSSEDHIPESGLDYEE